MLWQHFLWNVQRKSNKRPWLVSNSCWVAQKWLPLACLCRLWALGPWSRYSVPGHVSKDCCHFPSTRSLVGATSFLPLWRQLYTQNAVWGSPSRVQQAVSIWRIHQAGFMLVIFKLECVPESPGWGWGQGVPIKVQILTLGWDLRLYSSDRLVGVTWGKTFKHIPLQGRKCRQVVWQAVCWALRKWSPQPSVPQASGTEPEGRMWALHWSLFMYFSEAKWG